MYMLLMSWLYLFDCLRFVQHDGCYAERNPYRLRFRLSIDFYHVQHNRLYRHRLLKSIKMDAKALCTVEKIMQLQPECFYCISKILSFNAFKTQRNILMLLENKFTVILQCYFSSKMEKNNEDTFSLLFALHSC